MGWRLIMAGRIPSTSADFLEQFNAGRATANDFLNQLMNRKLAMQKEQRLQQLHPLNMSNKEAATAHLQEQTNELPWRREFDEKKFAQDVKEFGLDEAYKRAQISKLQFEMNPEAQAEMSRRKAEATYGQLQAMIDQLTGGAGMGEPNARAPSQIMPNDTKLQSGAGMPSSVVMQPSAEGEAAANEANNLVLPPTQEQKNPPQNEALRKKVLGGLINKEFGFNPNEELPEEKMTREIETSKIKEQNKSDIKQSSDILMASDVMSETEHDIDTLLNLLEKAQFQTGRLESAEDAVLGMNSEDAGTFKAAQGRLHIKQTKDFSPKGGYWLARLAEYSKPSYDKPVLQNIGILKNLKEGISLNRQIMNNRYQYMNHKPIPDFRPKSMQNLEQKQAETKPQETTSAPGMVYWSKDPTTGKAVRSIK